MNITRSLHYYPYDEYLFCSKQHQRGRQSFSFDNHKLICGFGPSHFSSVLSNIRLKNLYWEAVRPDHALRHGAPLQALGHSKLQCRELFRGGFWGIRSVLPSRSSGATRHTVTAAAVAANKGGGVSHSELTVGKLRSVQEIAVLSPVL